MKINQNECVGCGMCLDVCSVGAVEIDHKYGYGDFTINQDKCIECGECAQICSGDAIS